MSKGFTNRFVGITVILFLFFVQFSNVPIVNPVVAGKNLSVYLGYIVVLMSIFLMAYKILVCRMKATIDELVLLAGLFVTLLVSIISRNGLGNIWNELFPFLVPFLLYYPIRYSGLKQKTLLHCLFITNMVGGIISLLIATRVIEVETWAAANDLVRTAGFVDGTMGTVGFACAIVMLMDTEKKYSSILVFLGLIGSAMVVLFGLSRLRMVILACIFFIILFIKKPGENNITGKVKLLTIMCISLVLVLCLFPNIIDTAFQMMNTRFSGLGVDSNTTYRMEEMQTHITYLLKTFGMGTGWGVRDAMGEVFVHNVYTGVLMHCGILFGLYYIYFLLKSTYSSYQGLKKKESYSENMLAFVTMVVVLLTGFGGAGITQPGAWIGMALVYSREDK